MLKQFTIHALENIPMIAPKDDLARLIHSALVASAIEPQDGDILVIAQKIVSKAEGRQLQLGSVEPSAEAVRLATETNKDPRLVELILSESECIVRQAPGVLIVRHRLGFVCANAGIDQSNISHDSGESALLLPLDPDASARQLRESLQPLCGCSLGVIISDSNNRPWRMGSIGSAIGSSGITVLDDRRGGKDIYGRELMVTMVNRADSIATAALLVMGETTERTPVALVRGMPCEDSEQTAALSVRPVSEDLFR
jgi:coenzyme F420-0:L-glutamate ligase/coenzyme F420-1:gamma-L-glutamate ligase